MNILKINVQNQASDCISAIVNVDFSCIVGYCLLGMDLLQNELVSRCNKPSGLLKISGILTIKHLRPIR